MADFTPPYPLTLAARRTWDRLAKKLHHEGRWSVIDHELLALFCETREYYDRCKAEIDKHGVLIPGRNTRGELVRNPSLTPLNQFRQDLIRMAKAIPLADPKPSETGREIDQLLDMLALENA